MCVSGGVSRRLGENGRESGAAGIQEGGPGTYVGSVGTAGRVCMDLQLKRRDVRQQRGGRGGESTVRGERQHRSLQQGAQSVQVTGRARSPGSSSE